MRSLSGALGGFGDGRLDLKVLVAGVLVAAVAISAASRSALLLIMLHLLLAVLPWHGQQIQACEGRSLIHLQQSRHQGLCAGQQGN